MSSWNSSHSSPQHDGLDDASPTRDLDLMLARAVAGDQAALAQVLAMGARDASVLEELSMWQADELRLSRAARELDATAERVEVRRDRSLDARRVGLGWAAAAIVALAWIGTDTIGKFISKGNGASRTIEPRAMVAGFGGDGSADDAFEAYLAKARAEGVVRGEVSPPTLVGSRELSDGRGFEVVILRQVLETRVAPEMYRLQPVGETGRMRPIVIRSRTDLVQ